MKVLLEIGGQVRFIAPNAATAAKVADLLGEMQPAIEEYEYRESGPSEYILIHGATAYSHRVQIVSLENRRQFANKTEFATWKAGQTNPEAGKPETAEAKAT